MEISNPRRILVVAPESEAELLSKFIKDLTGTHPTPSSSLLGAVEDGSEALEAGLAGTTHSLALKTAYYSATVPVWLDTVAEPAGEWAASFLSAEAREVLAALGGVVVVFPLGGAGAADVARELVAAVGRVVREGLGGWGWDGVGLAVGVGHVSVSGDGGDADDLLGRWEDLCGGAELEFVHVGPASGVEGRRDEFGEKTGIPRVLEALQSNDWNLGPDPDEDGDDKDRDSSSSEFGDFTGAASSSRKAADLDPEALGFGFDRADFEGLRRAIWSSGVGGEDEDDQRRQEGSTAPSSSNPPKPAGAEGEEEMGPEDVDKVEAMMRRLLAVRDMSAGLPEDQRRRLAARAVGEVMKEL